MRTSYRISDEEVLIRQLEGKTCKDCFELKPLSNFYKNKASRDGHVNRCKACETSYKKSPYYKKKHASYQKKMRDNNPILKLRNNVSKRINGYLKDKGYSKKSKTYQMIQCNYEELLNHLNNNPYNFKYEDGEYDIDHIVPLSSAKSEEEIYKLCHFSNLQLLPSYYNRYVKKDNTFNKKELIKYLKNDT